MRKKGIVVVLSLVIALFVCGCSAAETDTQTAEEHVIKIGMSFDSLVIERWIRDRDAFIKCAKEQNVEVNVQNANGDSKEQIAQIQYLIDQKVDAIVVIPVDCDAVADIIGKAKTAGIKVISYDRLAQDANVDLYISFDNKMVGTIMAETMVTNIPNGGKIIEICGSTTDQNVESVEDGFQEVIDKSNLSVVYKAYCKNWEADEAVQYMEEALKQNSDIVGVMCGNDDIATRVCQVLSEHRMAGKVVVVGQDADLSACQRIEEETQTMTVFKQCENMAEIAAELAIALSRGEDVTGREQAHMVKDKTNDGTYDIPYYRLSPIAVTKENMQSVIIDSGFHDQSDVFLNVMNNEGQ